MEQRADDLMDFVHSRPEHEMSQVILLCINRETARIREVTIRHYEQKLEELNLAQRDLTSRILDELSHIKAEHEQQVRQL